jgi:hypothetical protein
MLFFQNCAQGGNVAVEGSSSFGSLGHAVPATAIVAINQVASGNPCASGYQNLVGTGDLSSICVQLLSSSAVEVIADVQLMPAGAACATGYTQSATFGVGSAEQVLCVKSETLGQETQVVSGLYEIPTSASCDAGDTLVGLETGSLSICESH